MTRKDYIAIAEAFRFARGHAMASFENRVKPELAGVMAAAEYVANAMKDDNPRFNREHFLAVVRGEKSLESRPSRNGVQS